MQYRTHSCTFDEKQLIALGRGFAPLLLAGDYIALSGAIGAGKTTFARALIVQRLRDCGAPKEPVVSPTFTLAQTYNAAGLEIWHFDFYRLSDPQELEEIGFFHARSGGSSGGAICLVEWPQIAGPDILAGAFHICLEQSDNYARRRVKMRGRADMFARLEKAITRAEKYNSAYMPDTESAME